MFKSISLIRALLLIVILSVATSCSKYNKALKSTDLDYKYEMGKKFYDKGDWVKAEGIFQELIGLYRGMSKAEIIYYYYAYCNYYMEDYIMAGYYFKNFTRTYPASTHAEECMYMSAYCSYLDSPVSSLDQSNSLRAIEQLQLYINRYPQSEKVAEANDLIDELRDKLESKAYDNALLYFKIGSYKASIVSFGNVLVDFPDTKFRRESFFYILKSSFLLAENSIDSKKKERYEATVKAFYTYEKYLPKIEIVEGEEEGKNKNKGKIGPSFTKEANSILRTAKQEIELLESNN
ncbi:MAG TPA: outer membrane protein assembly factor BamD [Flavobacteriales bacterium]|nr:outer membrane protein assembly factor BamD [Flavobacteriales bacterium]HIA10818.1 outer membrane protein assembly factor BamD [Flavobacteriales bacterium]